jgi:hypothetical protein
MIEQGLVTYLEADPGVSALVSARIYPEIKAKNPIYPCITYSRDGSQRNFTADEDQTDFVGAEIQIDAWDDDLLGAKTLAGAIQSAVQNYTGLMGTVTVKKAFIDIGPLDIFEEEIEKYRSSTTFIIWHTET